MLGLRGGILGCGGGHLGGTIRKQVEPLPALASPCNLIALIAALLGKVCNLGINVAAGSELIEDCRHLC